MSVELNLAQIIAAVLGPTGVTGLAVYVQRKRASTPMPTAELHEEEARRAVEATTAAQEWKKLYDEMDRRERDRDRRISDLESGREEDHKRIAQLERTVKVVTAENATLQRTVAHQDWLLDEWELREAVLIDHIDRQLPAPASVRPAYLNRHKETS